MRSIVMANGSSEGCGSRKPSSTSWVDQGLRPRGKARSYVEWISSNAESGLGVLRGPE